MNIILNAINFNRPLIELVLDTGDGLEKFIFNFVTAEQVHEEDVTAAVFKDDDTDGRVVLLDPTNFSGGELEILEKGSLEALVSLGEVQSAERLEQAFYFASGEYEATPIPSMDVDFGFIYSPTLAAHIPCEVRSVDVDYEPVSLTPVPFFKALGRDTVYSTEVKEQQTPDKAIAVTLFPRVKAKDADEDLIVLSSEAIMFFPYFAWVRIDDGPLKFMGVELPQSLNFNISADLLLNQREKLKKQHGVEVFNFGEGFGVRKNKDAFEIYTTFMMAYPFINEQLLLKLDEEGNALENPLGLEEEVIALLFEKAGLDKAGEIKVEIANM